MGILRKFDVTCKVNFTVKEVFANRFLNNSMTSLLMDMGGYLRFFCS